MAKRSVLNIDGIRTAAVFQKPYKWGMVENTFTSEKGAKSLAASFPEESFYYREYAGGRYVRRPLFEFGSVAPFAANTLPPAHVALAAELSSPEYRNALGLATGIDLAGAVMEASYWRYDAGSVLLMHDDMASKILTHIIYLNDKWHASWGGSLQILRSQDDTDIGFEVTPALGLSVIIARADNSWHSIRQVNGDAATSRNSLTIQFHKPGTKKGRDKY